MTIPKYTQLLIIFSFLLIVASTLNAQNISENLLESIDPDLVNKISSQNENNDDEELEKLFRSKTSVEKNKQILERLKQEINDLENLISNKDINQENERYGDEFFNTIQSSFMPVNFPNVGGDYIVGVGDELNIVLTGKIQDDINSMIQRDGSLLIPNIGKIFISGITFSDAETKINNYISDQSIGTKAFLGISKLRDVQVFILGGVERPGIYTISGGSNILHALNVAGGISARGSYRNVELKRDSRIIDNIDLYQTFAFGNIANHHYLQSGDVIFVSPSSFNVMVDGAINYPSLFEILPGETLEDLVNLAGGFSEAFAGYSSIYLIKANSNDNELVEINSSDINQYILEPRDVVYIPGFKKISEPLLTVTIEGRVKNPGKYYLNQGATLSMLIKMAGGYVENAYPYGSAIFREETIKIESQLAIQSFSDTMGYILSSIGQPGVNISSSSLELLSAEWGSNEYSGRVVANFDLDEISSNPMNDIRLADNDRIVIPQLSKVVYLFGEFRSPQVSAYDPNTSILEYISQAGGLKQYAIKEILVIDPDGKASIYKYDSLFGLRNSDIKLYPGSIIYASREIGKIEGVRFAATVAPIISSLALSIASLNSISD